MKKTFYKSKKQGKMLKVITISVFMFLSNDSDFSLTIIF